MEKKIFNSYENEQIHLKTASTETDSWNASSFTKLQITQTQYSYLKKLFQTIWQNKGPETHTNMDFDYWKTNNFTFQGT